MLQKKSFQQRYVSFEQYKKAILVSKACLYIRPYYGDLALVIIKCQ